MSDEPATLKPRRKRKPTTAQTLGGVIFGFEQQVWRTAPPPQELVHHARPDAAVPAKGGSLFTIELPAVAGGPTDASSDTHADQRPAEPVPTDEAPTYGATADGEASHDRRPDAEPTP